MLLSSCSIIYVITSRWYSASGHIKSLTDIFNKHTEALYAIIQFDGFFSLHYLMWEFLFKLYWSVWFIVLGYMIPLTWVRWSGIVNNTFWVFCQWTQLTSSLLSSQFKVIVCLEYTRLEISILCLRDVNSPRLTFSSICSWQLLLTPAINTKAVIIAASIYWVFLSARYCINALYTLCH